MNKYVDSLFAGRTCLTVVNPNMDDFMFKHPDRQQYAVFSGQTVPPALLPGPKDPPEERAAPPAKGTLRPAKGPK